MNDIVEIHRSLPLAPGDCERCGASSPGLVRFRNKIAGREVRTCEDCAQKYDSGDEEARDWVQTRLGLPAHHA